MNWLDKLERKFGRYAIRNLPLYIVMLYAIGAVLNIMTKGSYYYYVALNPYMILHGQVWRLLGFLIVPPNANIIFIIFVFSSECSQQLQHPLLYILFTRLR